MQLELSSRCTSLVVNSQSGRHSIIRREVTSLSILGTDSTQPVFQRCANASIVGLIQSNVDGVAEGLAGTVNNLVTEEFDFNRADGCARQRSRSEERRVGKECRSGCTGDR